MMHRRMRPNTNLAVAVVAALWLAPACAAPQQAADEQSVATPRTPDGKMDFSGYWAQSGGEGVKADEDGNVTILTRQRPCHPAQECRPAFNFARDSGLRRRMDPNLPLYKPEFWDKVQDLDVNGNAKDLIMKCYPAGLPRVGAPAKIVQTATEIILMYQARAGAADAPPTNTFRVIPIDGRDHDPIRSQDVTPYGDSVGRWEGDTLVIDSVGFTDDTWLGWPGYFHTNNMRVVERLNREGNTLIWQAIVHDPEVLMEPWEMTPVRRTLNPDPKALPVQELHCEDRDLAHIGNRER